jgi:hypothetical protein
MPEYDIEIRIRPAGLTKPELTVSYQAVKREYVEGNYRRRGKLAQWVQMLEQHIAHRRVDINGDR